MQQNVQNSCTNHSRLQIENLEQQLKQDADRQQDAISNIKELIGSLDLENSTKKQIKGALEDLAQPRGNPTIKLKSLFKKLNDTVISDKDVAKYSKTISSFLLKKRIAKMKTAKTKVALFLDESTDKTNRSVLLLCCACFDEHFDFCVKAVECLGCISSWGHSWQEDLPSCGVKAQRT